MILIIDSLKTPWFSKSCFFASRNNHVYLSYTTCYFFFYYKQSRITSTSRQMIPKMLCSVFLETLFSKCLSNAPYFSCNKYSDTVLHVLYACSLSCKKKNTPFSFWCSFSAFVAQLLFRYVPLVYGESVLEPTYRVCPIISRRL